MLFRSLIPCFADTELAKAVGFDIKAPTVPAGYEADAYIDISGELAEVFYVKGDDMLVSPLVFTVAGSLPNSGTNRSIGTYAVLFLMIGAEPSENGALMPAMPSTAV